MQTASMQIHDTYGMQVALERTESSGSSFRLCCYTGECTTALIWVWSQICPSQQQSCDDAARQSPPASSSSDVLIFEG